MENPGRQIFSTIRNLTSSATKQAVAWRAAKHVASGVAGRGRGKTKGLLLSAKSIVGATGAAKQT